MPAVHAASNSLFEAIRKHLPTFAPATIFDVGANVGQSAVSFGAVFKNAGIYSFEPIRETYNGLVEKTRSHPRIRTFRLALGSSPGHVPMVVNPRSSTVSRVTATPPREMEHVETVPMGTGDSFCAAHKIERIGFLKIDAEGHDLEVLIGFGNMLTQQRIDFAEAEVSMSPMNAKHVPFEAVKQHLEGLGYNLFHIYEQTLDVEFSGRPFLRRSNVVFISRELAEQYRRRR